MMRFRQILLVLRERLSPRDNAQPEYITPSGSIARFAFERRKLYADGRPRPHIFEPMKNKQSGVYETSVCGLNGMSEDRLWLIGANIREKPALAAVEVAVAGVIGAGLHCEPDPVTDPIDFPEHGLILGWHETDKSQRLEKMQVLADAYLRVLRP
jgi:hypothetical protein